MCSSHNVCQLAESEAQAVTGRVQSAWLKAAAKQNVFKLRLNERTDGEMEIFKRYGVPDLCSSITVSV